MSVTGTIPNGIQGTYSLASSVTYNGFVYMKATSNSFYITSATSANAVTSSAAGTVITSSGQAISILSSNYPLNRLYSSIYTFAITRPASAVNTLQIDLPALLLPSAAGITCGYQTYAPSDDYFNLLQQQGTNPLTCSISSQKLIVTGL